MNAVTRIDQTNNGIVWSVMPGARMLRMVVMKLIAPRTDEAPARCIDNMTMSTAGPAEPAVASGGGRDQPGPAPHPHPAGSQAPPLEPRRAVRAGHLGGKRVARGVQRRS